MLWILLITGLTIVGLMGLLFIGMTRMYRNIQTPHKNTPQKYGITFEEVHIPTKNNKQLYGWWIPCQTMPVENAPTVILVHGWNRNVERVMVYIRNLNKAGYNILAFDSRNHGSSDNDKYSSMVKFAEDIRSVVDFLQKRGKTDISRIGVIGLSIGGSAAIYEASIDDRVNAVMTVGSFAHPRDLMLHEFRKHHIPYFPLAWFFFFYLQWKIGLTMNEIAPENTIANSQANFLLIHGEDDDVCPSNHGKRLLDAGNRDKISLWTISDKGHSDCHHHPDFWSRVDSFLRSALDN